ncbi:ABC transporter ATP-binding protein [Cryobacterium arcticum]|uniref:ABC transporter ATP-binding protein n=1 Tax=Cryobacterium arcticum TaxID=670052 RepID=A0A317ZP43_9MICO|nr:ABC transporter ATP-binding protein [Cryobacterium arcticum]PXA68246.1 ABC transporter ATP-binding protein [Cryobacterium arcticum]
MTAASAVHSDKLPIADGRTVLREAWGILGRRWWHLVWLVLVLVAGAVAGIVSPFALGAIVDAVSAGLDSGDASLVWGLGALMAGAVIVGALLTALGVVAASNLFETMLAELRERMVAAAFALPQAQVERAGTSDVISRAGDDVAEVAQAIPSVVPAVTGAFVTIAVTVVGMAVIDGWYALALVVIVPVHVFAVRWYLRTAPQIYAGERAAMAERTQHLLDSLRGIDSVRAYGLGDNHVTGIARVSWAVVRFTMHARAVQNAFFARLNFAEFLGMAGLLIVGFLLVGADAGTIGGTTAAMLLFLRLFNPINQLLFVVDELQSALASLARIVGVITASADEPGADASASAPRSAGAPAAISAPPPGISTATDDAAVADTADITVPPGTSTATDTAAAAAAADTALRIEGVTHSYTSGHRVLENIDLTVRPGETVAIVGASGAGKSTLAAIAAGVHTQTAGTVHRPGQVVLVTQEVHVFDTTLRANLTFARANATDAEVLDALGRVGADRLVAQLPHALDTALGAGGESLTPAAAQQLALARVLLADPAVVILDESTAEAGSADADQLERTARAVGEGRAVLLIAHRLTQAAQADRVIVMERGRITEQGTHAELLEAGSAYARLWSVWAENR